MEARFTEKLESLQTDMRNLEGLVKSGMEGGNGHREQTMRGRSRRETDTQDAVNADYRLGILASEVRKSAFNETCKYAALLLKVQSDQAAALEDIRNSSANTSQGVNTILTVLESFKYYINNSFADFYKVKTCNDDSSLTDSTFHDQQVVCDEEWVIIQRRGSPTPPGRERTNFERIWEVYENGFGRLDGDFWLGLKTIHALTVEGFTQLRVDLEDWSRNKAYAMYDVFNVAGSLEKYSLTVAGYTGTAGDGLRYHNGQQFSTIDSDNDIANFSCAATYHSGWWYKDCHKVALNSIYHNSSTTEKNWVGVIWSDWKAGNYSLKKVEMKVRKLPRLI
ncbi:microfibril-associated glycoprotein 4 isoform X2 [Folsomia candida]|nr:microfibril-associated glycoprotein 4 isoform X2 [Folsomia candida]